MQHKWNTTIDSLGFYDTRVCTKCGVKEGRANAIPTEDDPRPVGIWKNDKGGKTPDCQDKSIELNEKLTKELNKIYIDLMNS